MPRRPGEEAMRHTFRVTLIAAAVVTGALVGPATVAAAGPPQAVTITSPMAYDSTGTFEASGEAVASGIICASGTVEDWWASYLGDRSGLVQQNMVLKQFVCDDDSGTFMVRLQNHLDLVAQTNWFSWEILSGTDTYQGLHGRGVGSTQPEDFYVGPWNDMYTGWLVG